MLRSYRASPVLARFCHLSIVGEKHRATYTVAVPGGAELVLASVHEVHEGLGVREVGVGVLTATTTNSKPQSAFVRTLPQEGVSPSVPAKVLLGHRVDQGVGAHAELVPEDPLGVGASH